MHEISQRPWGKYEKFYQEHITKNNNRYEVWVKRVEVKPQERLSLQKHEHRSEKWIIVAGEGLVTVNNLTIPVHQGVVIDVPLGAVHRIANTANEPLIFIEVATGDYLGEDDIIRLQDDYSRQ